MGYFRRKKKPHSFTKKINTKKVCVCVWGGESVSYTFCFGRDLNNISSREHNLTYSTWVCFTKQRWDTLSRLVQWPFRFPRRFTFQTSAKTKRSVSKRGEVERSPQIRPVNRMLIPWAMFTAAASNNGINISTGSRESSQQTEPPLIQPPSQLPGPSPKIIFGDYTVWAHARAF